MSDLFVAIHIATTCDEHGVYVTKDSAEVIEIGWKVIDAVSLEEKSKDTVLIRPVNTPITASCTASTKLTWEHVRNAGTFKEAVNKLDHFIHDTITSKGLDFTFISMNAWELRVQLPREARDKSVVLPPYLQHARVFDLRQEYSKWQAHHPEALSYSASNLSSIVTALEVELEPVLLQQIHQQNTSVSITPTTSSSSATGVAAAPPSALPVSNSVPAAAAINNAPVASNLASNRALEEVEIYASILKALIKKSTPVEDHLDVLTRPFDARADVRAFLAERSKVLHLSNLPNDTTQSELESWFTQFGGRPIAFWTLKTPDQHKPTGSGFAVFSSHEEAAESLSMNGRALNDKSIEVQPSSARVLDRAQEILTPFPPSKNRPRPGDWTCPSCGFSNFQRRTACFRCSFPATSAAAIHDSMYVPGGAGGNQHQHHGSNSVGMNNTSSGSSINHNNANNNSSMNSNGNSHSHNNHGHNNHGNGNNNNSNGNNINNGNGNGGHNNNNNRVSSIPFRAGDWKCANDGCSYHNFAKNFCCLRCGAPRVAPQQGQSTHQPAPPSQQQAPLTQSQPQQISGSYYSSTNNGIYDGSNGVGADNMKELSNKMSGIALNNYMQ